ncbi:MAG: hypothetical protein ACRCZP_16765 [Phycicoccus sp.]
MPVTATYDAATLRVKIDGTALTAPTVTVERSADGGATWTPVRGAAAAPVNSAGVLAPSVYDYEHPINAPVTYRARWLPVPTLVNSGTASSADNAAVAPGLPLSIQVGDQLVMMCGVRGAATLSTPAGWTLVTAQGRRSVWWRQADGTETTPIITPTGGAAGDTLLARIACFRGAGGPAAQANGDNAVAAQDVAYGGISTSGTNQLIATCLVKLDDWTSATPPAEQATAYSSTTLVGSDLSIAMLMRVVAGTQALGGGVLTVAGGAAAISGWSVIRFAGLVEQVAASGPIQVDSDRARLYPAGHGAGIPVTVVGWGDVEHADRATVIPIIGTAAPVVIAETRASARWTLRLRTADPLAAEVLRAALAAGRPVYLQAPTSAPFPVGWHHVGSLTVSRPSQRAPQRLIATPMTVCVPPAAP